MVSGLVLNFVPDPAAALSAMREAVSGGLLAAYVWACSGRMELMRHFGIRPRLWTRRRPSSTRACGSSICDPGRLKGLWHEAGSPASPAGPKRADGGSAFRRLLDPVCRCEPGRRRRGSKFERESDAREDLLYRAGTAASTLRAGRDNVSSRQVAADG